MSKILFVDNETVGIGNVIYFVAYCIKKLKTSDILLYHTNKVIEDCSDLFLFGSLSGVPETYDIKFSDVEWKEFLNQNKCDFSSLRKLINYEKLKEIEYPFDKSELCVINMRFGDYVSWRNRRTYKTMRRDYLDCVLNKYEVFEKFDAVVVVSDNLKLARYTSGKHLDKLIFYHSNPLHDFGLLLRAKFIIGSCSTFSFAGCMLNIHDAKMVVEYPYYYYPNNLGFQKGEEDGLYDEHRMIKETYENTRRQTISLCAMIKDENDYLEEWIKWNIRAGFDKLFLFEDIGSKPHDDICKKYKQITLIKIKDIDLSNYSDPCHGSVRQQMTYRYFLDRFRNETDWCAFIDADEFIEFEGGYNLQKLAKEFDRYPGVFIYWKLIGWGGNIKKTSNEVVKRFSGEGTLLQCDMCWDYKSILNFNYADSTLETIHRVTNGVNTMGLSTIKARCQRKCWFNHYFTKSWEEWLTQLLKRGDTFSAHRGIIDFFQVNGVGDELEQKLMGNLLKLTGETENKINCFSFDGVLTEAQEENLKRLKKILPGHKLEVWDKGILKELPELVVNYFKESNDIELLTDYIRSYIIYTNGGLFISLDFKDFEKVNIDKTDKLWFIISGETDNKKVLVSSGLSGNLIDEKNMYYIEKRILSNTEKIVSQMEYIFKLLFGYKDYYSWGKRYNVGIISVDNSDAFDVYEINTNYDK